MSENSILTENLIQNSNIYTIDSVIIENVIDDDQLSFQTTNCPVCMDCEVDDTQIIQMECCQQKI